MFGGCAEVSSRSSGPYRFGRSRSGSRNGTGSIRQSGPGRREPPTITAVTLLTRPC